MMAAKSKNARKKYYSYYRKDIFDLLADWQRGKQNNIFLPACHDSFTLFGFPLYSVRTTINAYCPVTSKIPVNSYTHNYATIEAPQSNSSCAENPCSCIANVRCIECDVVQLECRLQWTFCCTCYLVMIRNKYFQSAWFWAKLKRSASNSP